MSDFDLQGIGMTSARTRARMVDRLKQNGISNMDVLDAMKSVPRHIFVDGRWRIALMKTPHCPLALAKPSRSRMLSHL